MSYWMSDEELLRPLIGQKITAVHLSEEELTFSTEAGPVASYYVDGDCCSHSLFNDFIGLDKLLSNGPIIEAKPIDLDGAEGYTEQHGDCTAYYGYALTTEHPTFGPMTTVFSFRNESNGYYGGSMHLHAEPRIASDQKLLTEDLVTT